MLIALLVIFLLILAVLLFILFTTLYIRIDSRSDQYFVRLWGIFRLRLDPARQYAPQLITPFKSFDLSDFSDKRNKKTRKKKRTVKKKKESKKRSWSSFWKLITSMIRSFKVEECYLNWDTGDCISNAWLVPVFHWASSGNGSFMVNYKGDNELVFSARNRLIWLALPLIRFFISRN